MTPSPTHRQQAAGQKPKPSRSRYDATPVSQPEDNDEYISNSAPTKTAEMVTPSPTHRQQVAGPKPKTSKYRYDTALVSQQVRHLPSSSKFDTRNMFHILRTRAAKQATMSTEPANTLPCTQGYEKAAHNTTLLPAVKQQYQPTNGRSPSGTSQYERRLGYKKGAPNCRTRLQCAPRVHQYQPACPPSNIWKVEPTPKDTASNSSHNEKLINNNTSVAEDQAQMPQGTTTETLLTSKLSMQPKGDHKVSWYVNAIGQSNDGQYGKQDASVTGSTHASHRSARSPRPTPEGPARDNPIAGPRTGTTRSEPSAPASAGASGRHNEPGSRPASACPAQPPSKAGNASPRDGKNTTASGKLTGAPRDTGPDAARRTTPGHQARQRGTPPATTKAHGQVPSNNSHRVWQTRAASATRNEPRHR